METQLSYYKITVEGQYYVAIGDGKKGLKRYKFDVNLPTMDSALSIIKNKILSVVLKRLHSDYAGYRTHEITNVVPFGNVSQVKAELWQMNRETIKSYIHENELPVKEHIYITLMELRQAVQMAETDPDNFAKVQIQTEKDFKLTEKLRELNPELYALPEEEAPKTVTEKPLEERYDPKTDPNIKQPAAEDVLSGL